ncbi:radical SAM protein, partial [bacterium]|nr:radical SAM protein [candidate division CSSED10-310 bacterium]
MDWKSWVKCANRWLSDREYRARRTVLRSRPWSLQWDITSRCNLSCIYCSRKLHLGAGMDMPAALVDRVRRELLPYASNLVLGGMGEPLLHPEIKRVFRRLERSPFSFINLITNGTLLDDEMISIILGIPINQVVLSLDSVRPDVLPRIRRGLDFPRLMALLENLTTRRAAISIGPKLVINMVLNRLNVDQVKEMAAFAIERGFHQLCISTIYGLIDDGAHRDGDPLYLTAGDRDRLRDDLPAAAAMMAAQNLGFSFNSDRDDVGMPMDYTAGNLFVGFPPPRLRDPGVDWSIRTAFPTQQPTASCSAPWRHMLLHANGDVSLCCFSIGKPLATITDKPVREAWNSRQ